MMYDDQDWKHEMRDDQLLDQEVEDRLAPQEPDLLDTLSHVFGGQNVFVMDEAGLRALADVPVTDRFEERLRAGFANLHAGLDFLYSLPVADAGEYKSMVKQFEMEKDELEEKILKYFGLPEDWS